MEEAKRKGGGAKTARSETVTVRLDPQLRFLAELASRKQRRTLSSYIEWAVEQSLKNVNIDEGSDIPGDDPETVQEAARRLWDIDAAERFVKLAIGYPSLLNHDEQEQWKMLLDSGVLDLARTRASHGGIIWDRGMLEDVVCPALRALWDDFQTAYHSSSAHRATWVRNIRKRIESDPTIYPRSPKPKQLVPPMSDDIPF